MGFIKDFEEFLKRGNVVDLAVAMVMGTAFTAIVNSCVEDIITPFIGLIINVILGGSSSSLVNLFFVLQQPVACEILKDDEQLVLKNMAECGATTLNYGVVIDSIIRFFIISFIMFLVVRAYARAFYGEGPQERACPFCTESISIEATRCCKCTSQVNAMTPEQALKEVEAGQ